jgi:hypothetical protein
MACYGDSFTFFYLFNDDDDYGGGDSNKKNIYEPKKQLVSEGWRKLRGEKFYILNSRKEYSHDI